MIPYLHKRGCMQLQITPTNKHTDLIISLIRIPCFMTLFLMERTSGPKALEYRNKYGVDGIMIGRASIGYPWIFDDIKHYFAHGTERAKPTVQERVAAAREHFELSLMWKEERYAIMETRKHYTNYFRGLTHFKPYRSRLVTIENPVEVLSTLNEIEQEYISKYGNVQELGDLNNLQYGKTEEKQIIV